MKIDSMFSGLNISAAGMSAQRRRMNAIASNLANAETSKTEKGTPYRRKIVQLKAKTAQVFASVMKQAGIQLAATNSAHMQGSAFEEGGAQKVPAGIETKEVEDTSPPKTVYDPGNPDADPNGYVMEPNVNVVTEMVDMISASRAYEANVTAVSAAKTMAKDTLEI